VFEASESPADLPAFEFKVGTLEDGREVAFLDLDSLETAQTFVRHSIANRDALSAKNAAFDELGEAVWIYWNAIDDLESALNARAWSCPLLIGAGLVAGLIVPL